MAKQLYRLKIAGVKIHTRKFGIITEVNFTDEIGAYLLKSGQYDSIVEKIEEETETDNKNLNHGSKKSTGKVN